MDSELKKKKNIVLVAHDSRKSDLVEWCRRHQERLEEHHLSATGTTGQLLKENLGVPVHCYLSGPLGGDAQIGAGIVEAKIDMLIFFWDPLASLAHDPDVKALLRLATMYNIPMACNESSADFFISSPLMQEKYVRNLRVIKNYSKKK